jgi:hypothetical protein
MDDEVELVSNQLRERGSSQQRITELVLDQEFDDGVGEFVRASGARALGDQAGQASTLVKPLGLVENRTREPERLNDLGDGGPLHANAAEHLVLDLHQVARIEELAVLEHGVDHPLRLRVQGALLTQRFGFGVQGFGHEDLPGIELL